MCFNDVLNDDVDSRDLKSISNFMYLHPGISIYLNIYSHVYI